MKEKDGLLSKIVQCWSIYNQSMIYLINCCIRHHTLNSLSNSAISAKYWWSFEVDVSLDFLRLLRWLSYENKVNCFKHSSYFLLTFRWTLFWCFVNWATDDIFLLHMSHMNVIPKWTLLVWFFKWSFLLNKLPHSSHLKDMLSWWTSLICLF